MGEFINSKFFVPAIVIAVALAAFFGCCFTIDPGYQGVVTTLGKLSESQYDPGLHFKFPVISRVDKFDVRTKKIEGTANTYTSDIQSSEIKFNVTYNVKRDNVRNLYRNVGIMYEDIEIKPKIYDAIKDVIGSWQAQELVSNRDSARTQVLAKLAKKINKKYFENITFEILGIDYSDNFENSIEAKVVAEQKAQEAVNVTKQIEEKAKQKVITAEAEAKAMEITANALLKNQQLIKYEAVKKWDGKYPQVVGGNSNMLIGLGDLNK